MILQYDTCVFSGVLIKVQVYSIITCIKWTTITHFKWKSLCICFFFMFFWQTYQWTKQTRTDLENPEIHQQFPWFCQDKKNDIRRQDDHEMFHHVYIGLCLLQTSFKHKHDLIYVLIYIYIGVCFFGVTSPFPSLPLQATMRKTRRCSLEKVSQCLSEVQ